MDVEEEEKVACKRCRALLTTRRKAMVKEAAGCPPAKPLKFSKANNCLFGTSHNLASEIMLLTALVLAGLKRVWSTGRGTEESDSCLRIYLCCINRTSPLLLFLLFPLFLIPRLLLLLLRSFVDLLDSLFSSLRKSLPLSYTLQTLQVFPLSRREDESTFSGLNQLPKTR